MSWVSSFIISLLILGIGCFLAFIFSERKSSKSAVINSFNTVLASVFLSATVMFIPIYTRIFSYETSLFSKSLKIILLSLHNTLRLFIVDGEFSVITDYITPDEGAIYFIYTAFAAILFAVAPVLTFGFVLTFFKNVSAYRRYIQKFFAQVYIFSELNEKSIALATDLKNKDKKRLIVFTDVFESNNECVYDLIERAEQIGAVIFKKDITSVNFSLHSKNKSLSFIVIGSDDSENLKHSLALIDKYHDRMNTSLYTFSTNIASELLFNRADKGCVKVRRINEIQSLISRNLYDNGYEKIFLTAIPDSEGIRHINAVIIGMGQHGTEMTKALSWFCQMDGYRISINSFDLDKRADSKFKALCPDLIKEENNSGIFDENESCYKITVHSDIDVTSQEFYSKLSSIKDVTYVFISLGNDDVNIKTAIDLRSFLLRSGLKPVIDTVVYNTEKKKALSGIENFSGQSYDIDFIGDLESSYCEDVVFGTDVEKAALARHMRWGDEDDFWKHEYNYRSSVASAIHKEMKIKCGISGITKPVPERSEDELWAIRRLEHRRWNAYMRSEGFVFADKRNNLAKTHHLIRSFNDLPLNEQIKDDD